MYMRRLLTRRRRRRDWRKIGGTTTNYLLRGEIENLINVGSRRAQISYRNAFVLKGTKFLRDAHVAILPKRKKAGNVTDEGGKIFAIE